MQPKHYSDSGFTLIELLVVIIIVGILAAIALPSFLNQANKAKETEARQMVGALNRAQQAYLLETNGFSSDITALGLGIKTDTVYYSYAIAEAGSSSVVNVGFPKNPGVLRAVAGGVQAAFTMNEELTTLTILCQSIRPQAGDPGGITFSDSGADTGPTCTAPNFEALLN